MTIHTSWFDGEQSLICLQFGDDWNWDELYNAIDTVDKMLVSVPQQVDLIIDIREGLRIPGDFKRFASDLLANPEPRSNEGEKVVVGANRVMRVLYNGVRRMYAHKLGERGLLFANTLEEAQELVAESRANGR